MNYKYFIFSCILLSSINLQAKNSVINIAASGISVGSIIAAVLSYTRNKSIFWAIIHGVVGWFYVIFIALTEDKYYD